jgi:hypothetical protein
MNAEVGRRYQIESQRRHNYEMAQLQTKIELRREAFAALPPELVHAAHASEETLMPLDRWIMTSTPPIPGFDPNELSGD